MNEVYVAMYITLFSIVYIDQHQMNVRFFEVHGDPILDGYMYVPFTQYTYSEISH